MIFSHPHFPRHALAAALAVACLQAAAQGTDFDMAAQPLPDALRAFASRSGAQLVYPPQLVQGRQSAAVSGARDAQGALAQLLRGSGLQARRGGATWTLEAVPAGSGGGGGASLGEVTVRAAAERESPTGPVRGYIAQRSATASKTDAGLRETPQSISVITAERIEAMGSTNVRDALAYTPGIDTTPWGSESRYDSWIVVRGFDGYTPGYYMDGLPLRNMGNFGIWQTENYNTERIEVLRGPASVLYGQNPPGGMVNVVTKRPTEQPVRELQVQLGDHARRQVAGDFAGPLNEDGTLLYRVTGLVRDAEMANSALPNDRLFIAPSLTWKPSGDTSLTVSSHYLRTRSGVSYRTLPVRGTLLPNPNGTISGDTFLGEPGFDRQSQEQWALGYALEHRFNDTWTVRQNVRYGRLNMDLQQIWQRPDFIALNPADPLDPANFRQIGRYLFGSKEKVSAFAMDNHAQATLRQGDWQHTVLLGLDYQQARFDQVSILGGSAPPLDVFAPVYGGPTTQPEAPYMDARARQVQTGLYLQDQVRYGDHWVALLGGRYDRASSTTDNRQDGSVLRLTDSKATGRAGLVYLADNGWAPYVSYAQSFMPTATIDPVTGQAFKPETGRQYEAGIRYQPPGRKDSYSAAVFDLRRQNYITYDTEMRPRQTGEVAVRGLELEALVQPVPRMNLTLAYAYTPKAGVTASSTPAEVGKQITPVSRHRLSAWADYRLDGGLKLGLGMRYVGANSGQEEASPARVPAYTLWDAMVGYDTGRWALALNLHNLANTTYIATCGARSCNYGDQRTVSATATYRW